MRKEISPWSSGSSFFSFLREILVENGNVVRVKTKKMLHHRKVAMPVTDGNVAVMTRGKEEDASQLQGQSVMFLSPDPDQPVVIDVPMIQPATNLYRTNLGAVREAMVSNTGTIVEMTVVTTVGMIDETTVVTTVVTTVGMTVEMIDEMTVETIDEMTVETIVEMIVGMIVGMIDETIDEVFHRTNLNNQQHQMRKLPTIGEQSNDDVRTRKITATTDRLEIIEVLFVCRSIRPRAGDEHPSQQQESGSGNAWRPKPRATGDQRDDGRDSGRNTGGGSASGAADSQWGRSGENNNWRQRERTRLDR